MNSLTIFAAICMVQAYAVPQFYYSNNGYRQYPAWSYPVASYPVASYPAAPARVAAAPAATVVEAPAVEAPAISAPAVSAPANPAESYNPYGTVAGLKNSAYAGIPKTGDIITSLPASDAYPNAAENGDPNTVPAIQTDYGTFPIPKMSKITPAMAAKLLPVLKSLVKVMEIPVARSEVDPFAFTNEVGTLLTLSRDLSNAVPQGQTIPGFTGFSGTSGTFGLPKTGPVVDWVVGKPYVVTENGAFPISEKSFMTAEQKAQFLPATKSFIKVLESGEIDTVELENLLKLSRELNDLIPSVSNFN